MPLPYVVTISSEKGGVGKTTLATNLAIFLKALDEELPVTLASFDNHFSVDRMFRIGQRPPRGDVADLLHGRPAEELIETGEFGVQFIPSSRELALRRHEFVAPQMLADTLAGSDLPGVLILDTRPDLDIFTQNALYAADRVIVPVKDAPSLENSRHLYEFFDRQRLSRQALKILPCLIDFRIQYDGPFRDPHQLMRAYAINRGYRCYESFISKSPKVESLNTNPDGRIYPVLTHGRGTDVHQQFVRLAGDLLNELRGTGPQRLAEHANRVAAARHRDEDAYRSRLARLAGECALCGTALLAGDQLCGEAGYFAMTSDGRYSGFLEELCFTRMVFANFYGRAGERAGTRAMDELFRDSARRSWFVLARTPGTRGFYEQQLSFIRFDDDGLELSSKPFQLKQLPDMESGGPLDRLLKQTLLDTSGCLGDDILLLRKVSCEFPFETLLPEPYDQLERVLRRIRSQLVPASQA